MQFTTGPALMRTRRTRHIAMASLPLALLTLLIVLVPGCGEVTPTAASPQSTSADSSPMEGMQGAGKEQPSADGGWSESAEMPGGGGGIPAPRVEATPSEAPAMDAAAAEPMDRMTESAAFSAGTEASVDSAGDPGANDDRSEELLFISLAGHRFSKIEQPPGNGGQAQSQQIFGERFFAELSRDRSGERSASKVDEARESKSEQIPLRAMIVNAMAAENLAVVRVQQSYTNESDQKINAVYQFSPGREAAMTGFVMMIGKRQIRAVITDHATADRLHEEAKRQGYVASLMEQDLNGLVNVRIANLEPGSSVDVEFTYFSESPFRDGGYEFAFPQFAAVPIPNSADPDSERFQFSLDVQTAGRLDVVECVSHVARITPMSDQRQRVELAPAGDELGKPIVVRYRPTVSSVQPVLMTDEDRHGKYFSMAVYPPVENSGATERPLELVFLVDDLVLDSDIRLSQAAAMVREVLSGCRAGDAFQMLTTSGLCLTEDRASVEYSADEVLRAEEFLRGLTPVQPGASASEIVHEQSQSGRARVVILVTAPTAVGVDRGPAWAAYAKDHRVTVEVGEATLPATIAKRIADLRTPVLTDIEIEGAVLEIPEVSLTGPSELLPGEPLMIRGRFEGEPSSIILRGMKGGENLTFNTAPSSLVRSMNSNPYLSILGIAWAQTRISRLLTTEQSDSVRAEITELGKTYGLVTPYTSYAVVDALSSTGTEPAKEMLIPQVLPNQQPLLNGFNTPDPRQGG